MLEMCISFELYGEMVALKTPDDAAVPLPPFEPSPPAIDDSQALRDVREKGYGVVMPLPGELRLEEPQIVRSGGRYSVRLKASAPSIHMMMTNIETEVTPALGGEKASEEIMGFLLQGFDGDVSRIWESNIFGKSLYDIAEEGLESKIKRMPPSVQAKLRNTMQRIVNEGSGGLICIIL